MTFDGGGSQNRENSREGDCILVKAIALISVLAMASLSAAGSVWGAYLLRVEGGIVMWPAPAVATTTVITYAMLREPYLVARNARTLSPDNCGSMLPFADIVAGSAEISEDGSKGELRSAFAAWELVADVKFVEVREPGFADIVVGATETPAGRAFANLSLRSGQRAQQFTDKALGGASGSAPSRAAASPEGGGAAFIDKAFVCLNPKMRWKVGFDGNLVIYDLRHTFMHEIGHAIGLDHPGRSGSIMGFRYDESVREPQPSDIIATQRLYGPPVAN